MAGAGGRRVGARAAHSPHRAEPAGRRHRRRVAPARGQARRPGQVAGRGRHQARRGQQHRPGVRRQVGARRLHGRAGRNQQPHGEPVPLQEAQLRPRRRPGAGRAGRHGRVGAGGECQQPLRQPRRVAGGRQEEAAGLCVVRQRHRRPSGGREPARDDRGAQLLHVPYKGGGPAIDRHARRAGRFLISSLVSALPLIKDRKLRALAVPGRRETRRCPTCRPSSRAASRASSTTPSTVSWCPQDAGEHRAHDEHRDQSRAGRAPMCGPTWRRAASMCAPERPKPSTPS